VAPNLNFGCLNIFATIEIVQQHLPTSVISKMAPKPAARAPAFGHPWTSLDPPLTQWIADVIAQQGWERMTPVQAGTIPRAIKNQDCVVEVRLQWP
jgi:superfamily II DNA/RNA helicase